MVPHQELGDFLKDLFGDALGYGDDRAVVAILPASVATGATALQTDDHPLLALGDRGGLGKRCDLELAAPSGFSALIRLVVPRFLKPSVYGFLPEPPMAPDLLAGDLTLLRQLVDGRLRNLQVDAEFVDRKYLTGSIPHRFAPVALKLSRCRLVTPCYYSLLLVAVNPVRGCRDLGQQRRGKPVSWVDRRMTDSVRDVQTDEK